jgi:hypothetical protein
MMNVKEAFKYSTGLAPTRPMPYIRRVPAVSRHFF